MHELYDGTQNKLFQIVSYQITETVHDLKLISKSNLILFLKKN